MPTSVGIDVRNLRSAAGPGVTDALLYDVRSAALPRGLFHAMAPSVKTYVAKPTDRERNWLIVDANGKTLGRLATQIADVLRRDRKSVV